MQRSGFGPRSAIWVALLYIHLQTQWDLLKDTRLPMSAVALCKEVLIAFNLFSTGFHNATITAVSSLSKYVANDAASLYVIGFYEIPSAVDSRDWMISFQLCFKDLTASSTADHFVVAKVFTIVFFLQLWTFHQWVEAKKKLYKAWMLPKETASVQLSAAHVPTRFSESTEHGKYTANLFTCFIRACSPE